ncbi:MAG: T9SS type A sorting domain-containing protein [Ignavibacteria bacterium]
MKLKIFYIFIFLLFLRDAFSQSDPIQQAEILIRNSIDRPILVKVFPVGAVFSGHPAPSTSYGQKYSLVRCKPSNPVYWPLGPHGEQYIIGGVKLMEPNEFKVLDFDDGEYYNVVNGNNNVIGGVSYGLWKFEFYDSIVEPPYIHLIADCYIDYRDFNHGHSNDLPVDIYFDLVRRSGASADSLLFKFKPGSYVNIFDSRIINKTIKSWHKVGVGSDIITPGSPDKGFFKTLPYFFSDYPIDATQYGAVAHINPSDIEMNLEIDSNGTKLISGKTLNFKNANLTVKDGKNFEFESNSKIIFNGVSRFRTFQSTGIKTITMGQNSGIELNTNASINLNNTKFISGSSWNGIKLNDTYLDTIKNCEFYNAPTFIDLSNSNKCFARNKKIISGNTFNNGVVKLTNTFQSLINNNIFNHTGLGNLLTITNNVHPNDVIICNEEEESAGWFNLNIVNNHFSGGSVQMYLNCLAADFTPFYISNNSFGGSTAGNGFGLVCNKISGDFKYNNFTSSFYNSSAQLYQSNLNFYQNRDLKSNSNPNITLSASSTARLAPVLINGSYYWYGGLNKLVSENHNNIYFNLGSNTFLEVGVNCLIINNTSYYNVKGSLSGTCARAFPARFNYWFPYPPTSDILCNGSNLPLNYNNALSECSSFSVDEVTSYEIIDRGDGIFDSIPISNDIYGGEDDEDEEMMGMSMSQRNSGDFDESINSGKILINNYDTSNFIYSALDEIYSSYQLKDTLEVESNTIVLFSELKNYLESKIQQYATNESVVEKAYSYYLMSLIKLKNYNEAIAGYDNIINNHPDETVRLLASWDRSAVTLLLGGSGGGENNILSEDERLEKLLNDKPAHQIAKGIFVEKKNDKSRKENFTNKQKSLIEHRITKFNPTDQNDLSNKIESDLNLLLGIDSKQAPIEKNISFDNYILHQNYPNPFNPITTISYSLPKNAFVKLKVFDIAGKEVKVLINEYKQAGNYEVVFDGSNLSSGVYYYKINSGNYFEIKKMVLIK